MKDFLKKVKFYFECIRCFPHLMLFVFHRNKTVIALDVNRWLIAIAYHQAKSKYVGLIYLLAFYPEFRNLFYKRVGLWGSLLNIICPRLSSLYIVTEDIGPGLFIQHGFSTIIAAKSIGSDCWINQQVTIGYGVDNQCPVIGDGVHIKAGAKLFNDIVVGSNTIVGANAVVNKNVPPDCTVVGIPAYIIKLNGKSVKIALR